MNMIDHISGQGSHKNLLSQPAFFLCSYLTERKILDGISFVVPAGKSVAIVGTSGSGN